MACTSFLVAIQIDRGRVGEQQGFLFSLLKACNGPNIVLE